MFDPFSFGNLAAPFNYDEICKAVVSAAGRCKATRCGWAAMSAYGGAWRVFGLFQLASIMLVNEPKSKLLFAIHMYTGLTMAGLIALHVGAAVIHALVKHDGVMARMLLTSGNNPGQDSERGARGISP